MCVAGMVWIHYYLFGLPYTPLIVKILDVGQFRFDYPLSRSDDSLEGSSVLGSGVSIPGCKVTS